MNPADYHRVLMQAHSVRLLALHIDRDHLDEAITEVKPRGADAPEYQTLVAVRYLLYLDAPDA